MKKDIPKKKTTAHRLFRELQQVWRQQRALGKHKLKNPIQKGWTVEARVREDILNRSDADVFMKMVKQLPFNKHIVRDLKNLRQDKFDVFYLDRDEFAAFHGFTEYTKKRMQFPDHFWTKYFESYKVATSYTYANVEIQKWRLNQQYNRCFEFHIVPNMINEIPIIDPDLESQEKIIKNQMEKNDLWRYIYGNNDDGYHYEGYQKKQKELEQEFHKEIWGNLNEKEVA